MLSKVGIIAGFLILCQNNNICHARRKKSLSFLSSLFGFSLRGARSFVKIAKREKTKKWKLKKLILAK